MRDELNNIANIEKYLAGELSPEQAAIIEERMASNADFAENVNAQREITDHFKVRAFAEAVQTHQIHYNRIRLLKSILIVVTALLMIGFAVYQFIPSSESSLKENDSSPTEVFTSENKQTKLIQTSSETDRTDQRSLPKPLDNKQTTEDKDTIDNTINLLTMRDAFSILPNIDNDIADMVINDSPLDIAPMQRRTIWKIEDRFAPYYYDQTIPIKVTSKDAGLDIEYSFTASKGTKVLVTLSDPTGKEYEVMNMTEEFKELEVTDQLELEYAKGSWKIHIQTVGQGYFSIKINSNE